MVDKTSLVNSCKDNSPPRLAPTGFRSGNVQGMFDRTVKGTAYAATNTIQMGVMPMDIIVVGRIIPTTGGKFQFRHQGDATWVDIADGSYLIRNKTKRYKGEQAQLEIQYLFGSGTIAVDAAAETLGFTYIQV